MDCLEEFLSVTDNETAQCEVLNRYAQNLPVQCRTASGSEFSAGFSIYILILDVHFY